MSIPDFPFVDMHGYDPYNHVGVQIRRYEAFKAMQRDMQNQVFVMSPPPFDILKQFEFRESLDAKVKAAFMIPPHLLGTPVIRHDKLFGKITDIT